MEEKGEKDNKETEGDDRHICQTGDKHTLAMACLSPWSDPSTGTPRQYFSLQSLRC